MPRKPAPFTQLRSSLETVADQVSRGKASTVAIVRRGFFYTNGGSSEGFARRVQDRVEALGWRVTDHGTVERPFHGGAPTAKQSHWWARIELVDAGTKSC